MADEDGDTPLHIACAYAFVPQRARSSQQTVMGYGGTDARVATIQALLDRGGNLEVRDALAATPADVLHTAYTIQLQDASKSSSNSAESLLNRYTRILEVMRLVRSSPFNGNQKMHRVVRGAGRRSESFSPIVDD